MLSFYANVFTVGRWWSVEFSHYFLHSNSLKISSELKSQYLSLAEHNKATLDKGFIYHPVKASIINFFL